MTADEAAAAIERLQAVRFTGSITFHMAEGDVKLVEEKRQWKPDGRGTIDTNRAAAVPLPSNK